MVVVMVDGALHRDSAHLRPAAVAAAEAIPAWRFGAALGVTAASYLAVSGYDGRALRFVGQRVPLRSVV